MQAQLQGVEVEPAGADDDDLAVDDAARRQPLGQHLVQIREVAVELAQVAALDRDLAAGAAEHQGAKAVPLRLEQELALGRQRLGDLGQHRLDRRGGKGIRPWRRHAGPEQSARRLGPTPTYDRRLDIWSPCKRRDEG